MNNVKDTNSPVDVVLIYPKTGMDVGSTVVPPHALLAIAAPLHKKGYKIKIVDQRRDFHWRENLIKALAGNPVCAGISSMTGTQIYFAIEAAKVIRKVSKGSIPIIWGGPHPSILPEQTLQNEYVDMVCVGEGDVTFAELVEALFSKKAISNIKGIGYKDGSKITLTGPRELIDVETLLPVPWDLINPEDYIQPDFYLKTSPRTLDIGQTSRGCPFKCGFCSSASIRQRKWRAMSVEKSLDMIVRAVRTFKLNGIWIRDDEFYIDRKRAYDICEGILRNDLNIRWYTSGTRVDVFNKASDEETSLLKKSGAYVLKFGAESGTNRVLKLMEKGILWEDTLKANLKAKKHGIIPAFGLMIGFPTETFREINQTIDLALKIKKDNPAAQLEAIATYTALPATPLFDLALEYGLKPPQTLEGWVDWDFLEYDLAGKKIPWFNYRERKKIGNISYMYTVANAVPNLVGSIKNRLLKYALIMLTTPLVHFYRFRMKRKYYTFAPELAILRRIRNKIFYKGYYIIK
ncbi:MAG: B12-binding domain-containing radical SAM protein [Candidatus Omnitrophica bacterium]|nr:B12-binding domain-containing radical SAM protein [Candidatus Omnitrophota bacterium]MBU1808385.1 B12-binding domain-containing radical SAM protein [Candidatus Omnitrophota bacterium]